MTVKIGVITQLNVSGGRIQVSGSGALDATGKADGNVPSTASSGTAMAWNVGIFADGSIPFAADQSMGSHKLINVADPASPQDAATKNYVDMAVAALAAKDACVCATTTGLAAYTYNNVATPPSGVGATITLTVAAVLVLDGVTPTIGQRILIKNETGGNAPYNGIYALTTVGTVLINAVLTRTTDFDQPGDGINGALVPITSGTANAGTLWYCTTSSSISFSVSNITFSPFTGTTYTADGTTLQLVGTTFSLLTPVAWTDIAAINTLTAAYPALADTLPEYNAAAMANRGAKLSYVAGVTNPGLCGLRLSYSSTLPVTTADFSSQPILYWNAYISDRCSMYDAVNAAWVEVALGATSLQLPLIQTLTLTYTTGSKNITVSGGTTAQLAEGMTISNTDFGANFTITSIVDATTFTLGANPTGIANSGTALAVTLPSGAIADVYVVYNAGSPRLQFGNLWTNTSTRADTIGYLDGVLVNTAAINSGDSNGIAAKAGRYLGTVGMTATGGEDSKANRFCWNYYHRKQKPVIQFDTTASWTYATAALRQTNGNSANKVQVVVGFSEDACSLSIAAVAGQVSGSPTSNPCVGIGVSQNGTTITNSAQISTFATNVTPGTWPMVGYWDGMPAAGLTVFTMLEYGNGGASLTWYGNNSPEPSQTGMRGTFWC